jgi:L-fuconolactonase
VDPRRGDYGWLAPELAPIYRDFGLSDLAPHLAAAGIEGTILVQAAPTEAETMFLLDLAEHASVVQGVVGWTDFDAADGVARFDLRAYVTFWVQRLDRRSNTVSNTIIIRR